MPIDNLGVKKAGLKAGFWNFSTTIINQLRNLIVSIILARLLSPTDFGLIGMCTAFIGIVEAFVDFGFGTALVQSKNVSKKQISTVFFINLGMGLLFAVTMFCSASLIADFFKEPQLILIARVLSFSFIIKALEVIPSTIFKKELNYRTPFIISVISGVFSGIVGIVLAYYCWGVWALVYSQVLGWLIGTSLTWIKVNWTPMLYFNIKEIKELWRFGYKFSISVFIDQLFSRFNTIIIGKVFSASILGLFYRAQSLNSLVIQYSFSAFSGVLFPTLSKFQDDLSLLRYNVLKILNTVSFLTFFFAGMMIINAHEVISIMYGNKWIGAIYFFEILGLFAITLTIPSVLVYALMSIGRTDINLKIEIIKKIFYLISIPIGLQYGIYGYVWAINLAALLTMPLNMWAMKYISLPIWPQFKAIFSGVIPFFIILFCYNTLLEQYLTFENNLIGVILKSAYFSTLYLGYNLLIKSEGLTASMNIIKLILKR